MFEIYEQLFEIAVATIDGDLPLYELEIYFI